MSETTRPLSSVIPLSHGGWQVDSFMSSSDYTLRGLSLIPPNDVVPIILVPGIMGSNLRAKKYPRLGRIDDERNKMVNPGEPTWRPPNGTKAGRVAADDWDTYTALERQRLLDPVTLEVDGGGPIAFPDSEDGYRLAEREARERGWGEVHADSYGALLHALQTRLNQTFGFDEQGKKRYIKQHWKDVMHCAPQKWGVREFAPLTEAHLVKHAHHYFPVYAVGYCWLSDCTLSAALLEQRVLSIIAAWSKAKRNCSKVILVTHSMGGLVARACAKRIPDQIAGVIHGVMPALGAPVVYRRIACGTEASSPGNDLLQNLEASAIARILGNSTEKTTPVLATSAGALQLLPNQLYPGPWLHVRVTKSIGNAQRSHYGVKDDLVRYKESTADFLHLPDARTPNPYDLYRDLQSWYRLIDPALADPDNRYGKKLGGIEKAIRSAIAAAEDFHRGLGDYYHSNTYAFYGDDQHRQSYGQVRWSAWQTGGDGGVLTTGNIATAKFLGNTHTGRRRVLVEGERELHFAPEAQDSRGDGTVPHQSGTGVSGKVRQVFATQGYDHQGSYKNEDMIKLTLRLIVKIVQDIS